MEWLVVLNAAGGLVLVLAGIGKLRAPETIAGALRSLRLPSGQLAIGAIAGAEIGIGVAGALAGGSPMAWVVAAYWLLLAGAAGQLLRKPDVPCGCFGAADERVGLVHLLVDLAFLGIAVGTAAAADQSLSESADVARGRWFGVGAAAVLLAVAVRFLLAQATGKVEEPALASGPALAWAPTSPPLVDQPDAESWTAPEDIADEPVADVPPDTADNWTAPSEGVEPAEAPTTTEPDAEPVVAVPASVDEPEVAAQPAPLPLLPPVPPDFAPLPPEPAPEVQAAVPAPAPPPPPPPAPPPDPVERILAGVTPDGSPIELALSGHARPTLLAFLTDTCVTCREFWAAFGEGATPPGIDVVIVTMGPEDESVDLITRLAPRTLPTVMSSAAWDDYGIAAGPYFVLLAGNGAVLTHGPASTVASLDAMLTAAG